MTPEYFYENDPTGYAIEMFDHVELALDGQTFEGQVTQIRKAGICRVRYEDYTDLKRSTGDPKRKSALVPYSALDLLRRDG